jgi:hypothetical protein
VALMRNQPTGEQIAKLPKLVQSYIADLNREVQQLGHRLGDMNDYVTANYPGSNVQVARRGISDDNKDIPLPPDSQVDFYLGAGRRKYSHMIGVTPIRQERDWLRIETSGQLFMRPAGGCNVIEVSTDR